MDVWLESQQQSNQNKRQKNDFGDLSDIDIDNDGDADDDIEKAATVTRSPLRNSVINFPPTDYGNNTTSPDYDDQEYRDNFGYSLIVALRGKTTGRRVKKLIFKFTMYQILFGFPLFIISCYLADIRPPDFVEETYGSSIMVNL